jgi:Xaa-Pro aminopeptidase
VPSFLSSPTGGSGPSPAVSQGPSFRKIRRHEPVLVDYVFAHAGYIADHTRIFSLGSLPDELMAAHQSMLELQSTIKTRAKAGVSSGEIYEMALEWTQERSYADYFMGFGDERVHFVGHGVGLELDEFPFLARGQKLELKEGMTLALEPKLVFPDKGVVGIENTHVVTREGLEQLTNIREEIVVV